MKIETKTEVAKPILMKCSLQLCFLSSAVFKLAKTTKNKSCECMGATVNSAFAIADHSLKILCFALFQNITSQLALFNV